ncbi:MAG: exodeoxyribonuclease III [Saprospiraceae bacterium]|nr:exodeoxyribonuclease III [Saprospiraceae bacterium]MDW8484483.1 exodeoxyribonuclease III [Saprospiraceae bacterium]
MITILSYNVNGLRSAISKDFLKWLAQQAPPPDIVCLQEIKAQPKDLSLAEVEGLGYQCFWHSAEKPGYSGVATWSKCKPDRVIAGCGIEKYDREGRILRTDFGEWTLLNCYFPSGTMGDERQAFKMTFLEDFLHWIMHLRQERPNLLVAGDFNIAHTEQDIHDPNGNKKSSGFLPEERAWMSQWFNSGFTDAFRYRHPHRVEYSWWTFRANARAKNKGWRIDYFSVSNHLATRIVEVRHLNEVVHSDHCPVWMQIDLSC